MKYFKEKYKSLKREFKLYLMRHFLENKVSDCLKMGLNHRVNFNPSPPDWAESYWHDEKGRPYFANGSYIEDFWECKNLTFKKIQGIDYDKPTFDESHTKKMKVEELAKMYPLSPEEVFKIKNHGK